MWAVGVDSGITIRAFTRFADIIRTEAGEEVIRFIGAFTNRTNQIRHVSDVM
jgi:hypothetical protein